MLAVWNINLKIEIRLLADLSNVVTGSLCARISAASTADLASVQANHNLDPKLHHSFGLREGRSKNRRVSSNLKQPINAVRRGHKYRSFESQRVSRLTPSSIAFSGLMPPSVVYYLFSIRC